jgi:L-rhamnose isomerase
MNKKELIEKSFELAKIQYAALNVNVDNALNQLKDVQISLHCWQTDDVSGFEKPDAALSGGGIQVTEIGRASCRERV